MNNRERLQRLSVALDRCLAVLRGDVTRLDLEVLGLDERQKGLYDRIAELETDVSVVELRQQVRDLDAFEARANDRMFVIERRCKELEQLALAADQLNRDQRARVAELEQRIVELEGLSKATLRLVTQDDVPTEHAAGTVTQRVVIDGRAYYVQRPTGGDDGPMTIEAG